MSLTTKKTTRVTKNRYSLKKCLNSLRGCPGIKKECRKIHALDLIFVQKRLKIIGCKIQEDLHHGSDHYLVAMYINFVPDLEPEKVKRWAWKSANSNKVFKAAKKQDFTPPLIYNMMDIDAYMD